MAGTVPAGQAALVELIEQVTAIDFATGRKVVSVPVGDHPQRVRLAHVPIGWTAPAAG